LFAAHPDRIEVAVEHEGSATAGTARDRHNRGSLDRANHLHVEPAISKPRGTPLRNLGFAGGSRYKLGVHGVDADEVPRQLHRIRIDAHAIHAPNLPFIIQEMLVPLWRELMNGARY
jgi:hypothetical protein